MTPASSIPPSPVLTRVWLALVSLTALSWFFGHEGRGTGPHHLGGIALFAIAFFKVRLIILHFMEVNHAPLPLRLILEIWVVAAFTLLSGIYWLA